MGQTNYMENLIKKICDQHFFVYYLIIFHETYIKMYGKPPNVCYMFLFSRLGLFNTMYADGTSVPSEGLFFYE